LRDGNICSEDDRRKIIIRNLTTGACVMTLRGHTDYVHATLIIDEMRICSSSWDKTIKIWNTSTGVCERTLEGHTDWVRGIVLLLDGSISEDGSLKIWSIDTGVCDLTVQVSNSILRKIIQLHDGQLLVSNIRGETYILGANADNINYFTNQCSLC
jgi:WD40 repeat protein